MKNGINKVTLMGEVLDEPNVQIVTHGIKKTSFLLSTVHFDNAEEQHTEVHRLVFFNKAAEIVMAYVTVGSKIYVEGRIVSESWNDEYNDKRLSMEIHCDNIVFIDKKEKDESTDSNSE